MRTQQWVARAILVIAEAGQPIVAPLHHMLGNADEVGRGRRAMPAASQYRLRSGDQRNPHLTVRNCPQKSSLTPFFSNGNVP